MSGVMIACKDSSMCEKLSQFLISNGIQVLGTATKGAAALRLASRFYEGGVLLCTYALSDMTATELCRLKPDRFEMVVLLSARQRVMFRGGGILCLDIPINRRELIDTLQMLTVRDNRHTKAVSKPAQRTGDEKEIIFKAKALLMERNNMTEQDAHRFLQKASMDSGQTLVQVAQNILNGVL